MALLINAIRTATSDPSWGVKLVVTTALFFLPFNYIFQHAIINKATYDFTTMLISVLSLSIITVFITGCAVTSMNRNINNTFPVFPGPFSIFEVLRHTLGCSIVLFIYGIVSALIEFLLISGVMFLLVKMNVEYDVNWFKIFGAIISFCLSPCIIIPIVLYSARGKIADALRFDIFSKSYGNVIISYILLWIQNIFIIGIPAICLYFFFLQAFGNPDHISIMVLYSLVVVITFFLNCLYFSDLYDDVIQNVEFRG